MNGARLTSFEPNHLYTILTETHAAGYFHWQLFLAIDSTRGFTFHVVRDNDPYAHDSDVHLSSSPSSVHSLNGLNDAATNGHGSPLWRYECSFHDPHDGGPPAGCVTATLIGSVPLLDGVGPERVLGEYISERIIPVTLGHVPSRDRYRERKFSGRVWWREAVRQLDAAGFFLECTSVDALEGEIRNRAIKAQYLQHDEPLPRVFTTEICKPVF